MYLTCTIKGKCYKKSVTLSLNEYKLLRLGSLSDQRAFFPPLTFVTCL